MKEELEAGRSCSVVAFCNMGEMRSLMVSRVLFVCGCLAGFRTRVRHLSREMGSLGGVGLLRRAPVVSC